MMRMSLIRMMFASVAIASLGGTLLAQTAPKQETSAQLRTAVQRLVATSPKTICTFAKPNVACTVCHTTQPAQTAFNYELFTTAATNLVAVNKTSNDDLGAALASADASLCSQLGLKSGLVVVEVQEGGRAALVGLKANDILLSLADRSLENPQDLLTILKSLSDKHPADQFEVKILRAGKPTSIAIKADVRVALAPATVSAPKPDYYIGTHVNLLDATFRAHLDVAQGTGLIVTQIPEGTPAAKAGVKTGDILLLFDGQPLPDSDALRAKVQAKGPHEVKLEVLRAGKRMTLNVTPELRKPEATVTGTDQFVRFDLVNTNFQFTPTSGTEVLSNTPYINRLFVNEDLQAKNVKSFTIEGNNPSPDLTKKIEELTAQVQALTKAVEGLKAAQGEKK